MYVVTKDGRKLPVDDSSVDYEHDFVPFHETVGLYTDNTVLKPIWILELSKVALNNYASSRRYELECVKDLKYEHEPTQEEVLWAMSAYGLTRYDVAVVRRGFELDMGDED